MNQQKIDFALEHANRALSSKREPLVSDLSPLEFGTDDHQDALWELTAVVAAGLLASLFVLAVSWI
ncbi:MAG: hypothetical protein HRU17_10460 [Polyangiaceae bacterium]|nr:hypothetical protein [Polyangiaceae bacterium]